MAEPFETLREVGVALNSFRSEVSGQFTTLKWIMGGVAAVGLVIAGVLFSKADRLEEIAARNIAVLEQHTVTLERIEAKLDKVAVDTGSIRKSVQTASFEGVLPTPNNPSPTAFKGWVGVKAEPGGVEAIIDAVKESGDGGVWIFQPQKN